MTDTSDKLSDNFCLEEAKQELSNGEQTGSETKSYIKVPKARRMGSEVSRCFVISGNVVVDRGVIG